MPRYSLSALSSLKYTGELKTIRWKATQSNTQTHGQIQTHRQIRTHTHIHTNTDKYKHTEKYTHTHKQTNKQTNKQTIKQTNIRTVSLSIDTRQKIRQDDNNRDMMLEVQQMVTLIYRSYNQDIRYRGINIIANMNIYSSSFLYTWINLN